MTKIRFPGVTRAEKAEQLGETISLMAGSEHFRNYPIASALFWLQPPIVLGQTALFYNEIDQAIGFATWAFLSDEVAQKFRGGAIPLLHISEWNEGENFWMMSLILTRGNLRKIMRQFFGELDPSLDRINFCRRLKNGAMRHRLLRVD